MQPQNLRWLRDLRQRDEFRRDGVDVLPAWLLRERSHQADRIVLEVRDFGRHEAVDPTFGSHDVGEETGPVAVARVNVDDGGTRIDACELDQLGLLGLVVHRDLRYGWAFDERVACPTRHFCGSRVDRRGSTSPCPPRRPAPRPGGRHTPGCWSAWRL